MAHHPMILSGLRRVQVDLGDSRLTNYLLEHNYRWYRGEPNHSRFWDPPFFYPARNIAAYSDTFLGIAPLYAVFRAAGLAPDSSFQLWMMTLSVLNYVVMFHLLRRRLGRSVLAASAGAFLFAFGAPRVNTLVQQAQLPQFLSLITVDALFGLFPARAVPWWNRAGLWLLATAGLLAQLSSGFYVGWFTIFALGVAVLVAVWIPATRQPFLVGIWRDAPWIALAAVLGGLVLYPWLAHHLAASAVLGPRFIRWVVLLQPHPSTWLHVGSQNWLAGWIKKLTGFPGFQATAYDLPIGVGVVTTCACCAGLFWARDRASVRLLAAVAVLVFLCITLFPPGLVFVVQYLLILGAVAFAYCGHREHPQVFLVVIGLVLVFLSFDQRLVSLNPRVYRQGSALYALVLAIAAFVDWRPDQRGRGIVLGLIAGLFYFLIPSLLVLALGSLVSGLLAGLAAVLGWRSRSRLEAIVLGGLLLFASLTMFIGRPLVLCCALLAPLAVAAARRAPVRPPARLLPSAVFAGLLMTTTFSFDGSAWQFIFIYVPGARSLLFVSRVGLVMLIAWAVGMAFFLDALLVQNRRGLALAVGLMCLLEQGVTTPSFDKQEDRQVVSALARRVDARCEAFYYSPQQARFAPFKANLDAMWAGLECGKPTLNGYSGHTPVGWRDLDDSNLGGPDDATRLETALDEWRKGAGRSVGRVQWVGGPSERGPSDPFLEEHPSPRESQ